MRRGETWTVGSTAALTAPGPGLIGAFGIGADPVIAPTINFPVSGAFLAVSSDTTPNMKDWRLMDIKLDASSRKPDNLRGIVASGGIDQLTLLRLTTDSMNISVEFSEYKLDGFNNDPSPSVHGHHEWDQLSIVDMTVLNMLPTGWSHGMYLGAERLFFAGNSVDGHGAATVGVSHNTRFTYLGKAAISNNTLQHAGPTEQSIKLHSKEWGDTGVAGTQGIGQGYTRWVHIADNKIVGAYGAWPIGIGYPSSDPPEFRGKDIILERNWQIAGPRTTVFQSLWWSDITSRNNIFDMSAAYEKVSIYVGKRDPSHTAPDRVNVYNNTFYSSTAGASFIGVKADATVTNLIVKNNLAYAPFDSWHFLTQGAGGSAAPVVVSNNSSDAAVLGVNPLFSGPLSTAAGFKPQVGSYAVNAGGPVPVFSDLVGNIRPVNVAPDLGPIVH